MSPRDVDGGEDGDEEDGGARDLVEEVRERGKIWRIWLIQAVSPISYAHIIPRTLVEEAAVDVPQLPLPPGLAHHLSA